MTFDDWRTVGVPDPATSLTFGFGCNSHAGGQCTASGSTSRTATIAEWRLNPGHTVTFNTSGSADGGDGVHFDRDNVNYHTALSTLGLNVARPETRVVGTQDFRCDNVSYLFREKNGACLFHEVQEVLRLSASSFVHGEVAAHIRDAQALAPNVWPTWPAYSFIPGTFRSGRALRRLYNNPLYVDPNLQDAAENAESYVEKSRNRVRRHCRALRVPPAQRVGKQCDEFPFASTYEGAHYSEIKPSANSVFSVRYVDRIQNRDAGTELSSWFAIEHILAMDKFYVQIDPSAMERDAEPKLLSTREDLIKVDHSSIAIAAVGTLPTFKWSLAGHVLCTFMDGATLTSAAQEHEAQFRVELWSAAPAPDTSRAWEVCEEDRFVTRAAGIYYGGPFTMTTGGQLELPTAGTFAIRVYCEGRRAVQDFEEAFYASADDDDTYLELPPGLEKWLVQLWPEAADTPDDR